MTTGHATGAEAGPTAGGVGGRRARRKPVLGFVGMHAGSRTDRPVSQDETVADHFEAEGFVVRRTSSHRNRVLRTLHQLISVATWRDVDVVVVAAFSWQSFWVADFATAISHRIRRRKVIVFLHGGELPVFAAEHRRRVERVFDRADRILAPSRYLQEAFRGWGYDIGIVPNVIVLEEHRYEPRLAARPSLLWMRAFHANYGPVMALEVLARVLEDIPTVTLRMGGADHGTYADTRAAAKRLGVEQAVRFSGYLDDAARATAFEQCDLFLNTNTVDNMPVSVLEAAACGLVPVANRVGGVPALLTDGVDSRLVDAGDVDAMAAAIVELLTNPEEFVRLSNGARALAQRFGWEAIRVLWDEELERLVGPSS